MPSEQVITAEPWNVGSVVAGVILLLLLVGFIVWLILRHPDDE